MPCYRRIILLKWLTLWFPSKESKSYPETELTNFLAYILHWLVKWIF
jgi:hypothetical protein